MWYDDNGIVIDLNKSNYLSYNRAKFLITINSQTLENCSAAKYLVVDFDNNVFLDSDVDYVFKSCC